MAETPRIILFDIDGTLVTTGGAGAVAWRQAFEDLYGIPADIGQFTDAGMTDPDVGAEIPASSASSRFVSGPLPSGSSTWYCASERPPAMSPAARPRARRAARKKS